MNTVKNDEIRQAVRENYGQIAESDSSCCDTSSCCTPTAQQPQLLSLRLGYSHQDLVAVPEGANLGLGCGNPQAIADLKPGETVVDLGSGAGFDCFLAARQVGPSGRVIGVDMTPQMITKARANAHKDGYDNVEFRLGEIEHLPVADASVDVIISNCVINLSADKRRVLKEAFRVLKPGGRFAVSDVIVRGDVPAAVKTNMELWIGCVAGALEEREFLDLLREVGFAKPSIEPTRVYKAEDAAAFLSGSGLDATEFAAQIDGKFMGAFVRATKPLAQCCGPDCC